MKEENEFSTKLRGENLKQKISLLHEHENSFHKEISDIDKKIKQLKIRKTKLARSVSKNVLYRNNLIQFLGKN